MKKNILIIITLVFNLNGFSQIKFENGYFINNIGTKTECLIKNEDWRNNPTNFEYKLTINSEVKTGTINNVLEFGIQNISKFNSYLVKMDRSSNNISQLSESRNVEFNSEKLFLKHLVGGEINLYSYVENNLKRYFYSNSTSENPGQLIYKKFKLFIERTGHDNIFENKDYQKQLLKTLNCSSITKGYLKNIRYTKSDLIKLFNKYNECNNSEIISYKSKEKKKSFYLNLRPSYRNSSLSIYNGRATAGNVNFGKKTSFSLGLEAEFFLPFNKNKWSITIEPTYQSYKNEKEYTYVTTSPITTIFTSSASVEYKSVEFPIGIRHYMYLNDKSKLFINVLYMIDFNLSNKQIDYSSASLVDLDIKTRNNIAFGIGYKFDHKYSIEFRQNTSREILGGYAFWTSDYKSSSIILGVNIL